MPEADNTTLMYAGFPQKDLCPLDGSMPLTSEAPLPIFFNKGLIGVRRSMMYRCSNTAYAARIEDGLALFLISW